MPSMSEREYAELDLQGRIENDRDLDYPVTIMLDRRTVNLLDELVAREQWKYRSTLGRHLIESALRQRGYL